MDRIGLFEAGLVAFLALLPILVILLYLTADGRGTDPGFYNSLGPCGPGEDRGRHPCYSTSLPP
jgi:hypothetical protein